MKITTEHCIYAIIKLFYDSEHPDKRLLKVSNWKRLSKSGTGNNILRVFENKETGTIMNVISSDSQIFKISEGKPKVAEPNNPSIPGSTGIKQYLKRLLNKYNGDLYEMSYDISSVVKNWPTTLIPPMDGVNPEIEMDFEGLEDEPQDCENFEWIEIKDDYFIINCGGDWQHPLTITIKLIRGKLTAVNSQPLNDWTDGMSEDEVLNIINS